MSSLEIMSIPEATRMFPGIQEHALSAVLATYGWIPFPDGTGWYRTGIPEVANGR